MLRCKLKSDERVDAAIYMSDTCVDVCADSVKDQDCKITEEELVNRVRERIGFGKRRFREV